jgi:hypothetical protein
MRARWRRECDAEEEAIRVGSEEEAMQAPEAPNATRRAALFAPITQGILSEHRVDRSAGWAGGVRIADWGTGVLRHGMVVGVRAIAIRGIE